MASEATVLILSALFPATNGNIPPDKAAIVPDLLSHIQAMESLVQQGRSEMHKAQYRSIRDPRLSALVTDRIMELHGQMGPDWKGIACTIAQEFHETLSIDGVRGRYKSRAAQLEAHAAMSGEVFSRESSTISPPVGATDGPVHGQHPTLPPTWGSLIPRNEVGKGTQPLGNPEQLPETSKEDALKADILARHARGEGIKNIAEALDVRWQWVRAVCAKAPKPKQEDKSDAPSEKVLPPEPPAEPPTQSAIIQERPAPQSLTRAELDAKMWALHMAGKTPEEISDALYSEGLYYSEKSVRVRLISQGAML